jgi:hypothetical protein
VAEARLSGTQRLSAVYHDTLDLDLLRHKVILLRRASGSDAGWHLELPAGQACSDVHRPAGRSGAPVPAELTALVRSVLRERAVEPVARLRTTCTLTRLLDGQGRALAGRLPVEPVPHGHRGPRRGAGAVALARLRAQRDEPVACDPLVRLDVERARYAAEAVDTLFGPRARTLAKRMRGVQETLGSYQDSLLARGWLLAAAARAQAADEPTFTYGLLHAWQAQGDGDTDANLAAAARLVRPSALTWPTGGTRR